MVFAEVKEVIKQELKINNFRSDVARSHLAKYKFVPKGRSIHHEDDIFFLIFGMVMSPNTYKEADLTYQHMLEHADAILHGFQKIMMIKNIESITFGSCYMIVTCIDRAKSFIAGSMLDAYTDRSVSISGNQFWNLYNRIYNLQKI